MKTIIFLFLVIFSVKAQRVVLYEEIKNLPNHLEVLLIDVREPDEIERTGLIPTSINIPPSEFESVLSLSPSEFEKVYNRKKPQLHDTIIFTCWIGRRALTSAQNAMRIGYTDVSYYEGSWSEWCVKENQPCDNWGSLNS